MKRTDDWLKQARAFVNDAQYNHEGKSWYLACFLSQQSAEFAIKALCQHVGIRCGGHNLLELFSDLASASDVQVPEKIDTCCKILNKYFISTRYPDAYSSGSPFEQFSEQESRQAIKMAEEVIHFVELNIKRNNENDHEKN